MATATKNYGTISLQSSYYAYTKNVLDNPVRRTSTATVSNSQVFSCSFADLGIPAGSTINSAVFTYDNTYPAHGYAQRKLMSGTVELDTWFVSGDTININAYDSFFIRFQSGKDGTTYPPMPMVPNQEASQLNSSTWKLENLILTVDYTLPYTSVISPSVVSVNSNNVEPNKSVSLSWSGAQNGTNNAIAKYEVYRATSADGTYSYLGETTGTSIAVTAPSSNSSSYYYKVKAIGSVSGHDGELSTAYATLTCLFTAPSAPTMVTIGGGSSAVSAPSGNVELAWSGAKAGTNNPIKHYLIKRDGVDYTTTTNTSLNVPAHATGGSSYTYKVVAVGEYSSSGASADRTVYSYSNPSPPTEVSVDNSNPDAGANVTLSWSGAIAGSYNAIKGYHVYRATSADGDYSYVGKIDTTETSGSVSVDAPSAMGSSYYYKIRTIGEHSNSEVSSASASVTSKVYSKVTAPTLSIDNSVVDAGTTASLSWSGAQAGTNNPITGYEILMLEDGASEYTLLGSVNASTTTYAVTAHSTMGRVRKFVVRTKGTKAGFTPSDNSNEVSLTAKTYTAPSVPALSVSAGLVNPSAGFTVSWDKPSDGTNNSATKVHVYRSVNDGGFSLYKSLNIGTYSFEETAGNSGTKYQYRAYTQGTKSGFDSGYSAIKTVVVNTKPSSVGSVSASPAVYESGNVSVSWTAASDPNQNIAGYRLERSINGSDWALVGNYTGLSAADTPTAQRGETIKYRVAAYDSLGLRGDYKETSIVRNSAPQTPSVVYPVNNAKLYSTSPLFRVDIGAEPDNQGQSLQAKLGSGDWTTLKSGIGYSGGVQWLRPISGLGEGSFTVKFRAVDSQGAVSGEATISITNNPSPFTRAISKGLVIASETVSHQAEVAQLYDLVNDLRAAYGLAAITKPSLVGFNHASPASGKIGMFADHGAQMKALQEAISGVFGVTGETVTWQSVKKGDYPKAAVINQIRSMLTKSS